MNNKSHVSMEQRVCPVCTKQFDTGTILIDRRLCQSLDYVTVAGWGLCPDDQGHFDRGYIALIECDPDKSKITADKMQPNDAYRTGRVAHVKRELFQGVTGQEPTSPLAFVDLAVIDRLIQMYRDQLGEEPPTC